MERASSTSSWQEKKKSMTIGLSKEVEDFYVALAGELDKLRLVGEAECLLSFKFVSAALCFLRFLDKFMIMTLKNLRMLQTFDSTEWAECANQYYDLSVKLQVVCAMVTKATKIIIDCRKQDLEPIIKAISEAMQLDLYANRYLIHESLKAALGMIEDFELASTEMKEQLQALLRDEILIHGDLIANLNLEEAETEFLQWNGLWGAMFALRNSSFYVCQLILATVTDVDGGPFFDVDFISFRADWASSLRMLHIFAEDEISRRKQLRNSSFLLTPEVGKMNFMLSDIKKQLKACIRNTKFGGTGVMLHVWASEISLLKRNMKICKKFYYEDLQSKAFIMLGQLKALEVNLCETKDIFWKMCAHISRPNWAGPFSSRIGYDQGASST